MQVPGRPLVDDPQTELFEPVKLHVRKHDRLIFEAMDRTAARDHGRLLIMTPPGAAKTTNASIIWPSHYLGRRPGARLGLGSYGDGPAIKMGRRTRSMVKQARYKALFDTELTRDSRAGNKFELTNGSEYMAASISGEFPSNRFDGLIADDPVKGRTQANSEVERTTTWDEYKDNFLTRLVPKGWLVLIMTHWDEEDPAGHILPDGWSGDSGIFRGKYDGFDWEVLCLQAKCETHTDPCGRQIGEYLAPEWFDRKHWSQFENDLRAWNSLFQQRPRPIEGAFFHVEDMLVEGKPVALPKRVEFVYAVIDSAVKTGKAHDGLAVKYFARSLINPINPKLTVLDWEITQIQGAFLIDWLPSVFERLEHFAKECEAFEGSRGAFIEDKVSGTILLQQAQQRDNWHEDWRSTPIDTKLTMMGKKERALNVSGHVAAGSVKWTEDAYTKVMTYKNSSKNHALSQVLKVSMESKDTDPDDLLDTFTYGVAIGLGNPEGY